MTKVKTHQKEPLRTPAKTHRRQPLRTPAIREHQGTVYPHEAKVVKHRPTRPIEETFAIAATQLFESKVKDGFIIVRGILDLDNGFISDKDILDNLAAGDHLEPILSEPSRKTVKTSASHLPDIYNSMATHIRNKISSCIDHLNQRNNKNRRLEWENRQLRDEGTSVLLLTFPVPEGQQNMVQRRHLDFFGYQRKCLSCHIGISNGIRLQIYNEVNEQWREVKYGRGDILLVRGYKFHRGTNHSELQPKIRSFLYIDDANYAARLRTRSRHKEGEVFSLGLQDMDGYFEKQRLVDIKAKDSSGKAVLKAHRISIKAATRIKVEAMNRKGASKPSPPSSP